MEATLTELKRDAGKVIRAIEQGQTLTITDHGKPKARVVPCSPKDKVAAAKALMAIGPVEFLPRK